MSSRLSTHPHDQGWVAVPVGRIRGVLTDGALARSFTRECYGGRGAEVVENTMQPHRYSMLDVDQAPESPGIYAWYVKFLATQQDWRLRASPDGDLAIGGFLGLIEKYARYYEPVPIELSGRGSYGARWEGEIARDYALGDRDEESGESAKSTKFERLIDSLDTESRRKILAHALESSAPVFSAPLYIGVAEDLRSRLRQHRRDFSRASEWLHDHPEDSEEIRLRGKNFGHRAAARGIAMEHLDVWVLDLAEEQNSGLSVDQLRSMAESVEWLLHRLYTPILGRQ